MLEREKKNREAVEIINTEMYVPQDHLLRKIDGAVDFTQLCDFVEDLYCKDNGRPSIDPVVLFKMVLIQHIYELPSLRRTAEDVKMNIAYRWFLGYMINEPTPHFSTVSYNFKHRFKDETVERIFRWILEDIARAGYLSTEAVFVDGTHIKTNANMKKATKKTVRETARNYEQQLRQEINEDRERHGKKPFDDDEDKPAKEKNVSESTTDPDSGVFHKGEHKKCFAYEAHTACDKHGYILDTVVTPGNVHDSKAFDALYDKLSQHYSQMEYIVADSAYKTPWICKRIIDDKRIPSMAYVRPKTKEDGHEWWKYVYDAFYDCVICPQFNVLHYSTTNKDGYREYRSKRYICQNCPIRNLCTNSAKCEKRVTRHIWNDYLELAEDYRYTPEIKELYKKRKETIERCFADAKEKHGMRYALYRGITSVSNWVSLKFAGMNIKKYALHLAKSPLLFGLPRFFRYSHFSFMLKPEHLLFA